MTLPPIDVNALAVLRQRPRRAGEASFFFQDTGFGRACVKLLPGEFFVYDQDVALGTTLGSCVAACLHDPQAGIGGMNHFMLPDGSPDAGGRFGAYAMELLINEMIKRGARKSALQAKIFGGGQVMKSLARTEIGEKNVAFVQGFLAQEGIPVLGSDVLGPWPRKVCMFPRSGRVLCKRLPVTEAPESARHEEHYRRALVQAPRGGDVELFG